MIKYTLFFGFLCFCFPISSYSQDNIILKNGDEIKSKVLEVLPDVIKYKKWENQDGPTYTSDKGAVFMIKYQNGTKDVFNADQIQTTPKPIDKYSQVIEIARPFMNNQVSTESKGACKPLSFNKQNGMEKDFFGQKTYTLEYILTIELQKDFWKASADKWLAKDWYWGDFSVLEEKGDIYSETFTNYYMKFTKGTILEITGEMDFESTDNGWRITGESMFSYGYKNNKWRQLSKPIPIEVDQKPANDPIEPKDNPIKYDTRPKITILEDGTKPTTTTSPVDTIRETYIGDYNNGKKNGLGTMWHKNGDIYKGEWKDNKRNGQGKLLEKDGSIYDGNWVDDSKEGLATMIKNGNKYVGEVSNNGIRNGQGTLTSAKGNSLTGEFSDGKLKQGVLIDNNQKGVRYTYSGEFKDGQLYNGTRTTELINCPACGVTIGDYKNGVMGKERAKR